MQTEKSVSTLIKCVYLVLSSQEEFPKYNVSLAATILKIQRLIEQDSRLEINGKKAIQLLENQILTNNHYVRKRKDEEEAFSLLYCLRMQDLAGFKYLLRVGEDPTKAVIQQKTIVHLVEKKKSEDFSQAIAEYFKAMANQNTNENFLDSFEMQNIT